MQKPILIDVDGVCANFIGKAMDYANDRFNLDLKYENIVKDIREYYPWDEECENYIKSAGFCSDLEVSEPAQRTVKFLQEWAGERIIFVTSPYKNSPTWCHDRSKWLEEHFGATRDDIIFARDKRFVDGKALIDDRTENVVNWTDYNKSYAIMFAQPWNKKVDGIPRTNDWKRIARSLTMYG